MNYDIIFENERGFNISYNDVTLNVFMIMV